MKIKNIHQVSRRKFIGLTATAAIGSGITGFVPGIVPAAAKAISIREAINFIIKSVPVAPISNTVDTVKAGNPDQLLKGMVTTTFATIDVIEKAASLGANLIIVHEPVFYNHRDETDWLHQDKVFEYKQQFIKKTGVVIWRFHDYWHSEKPDAVLAGVLQMLGWQKFAEPGNEHIIHLTGATLGSILKEVKEKLGVSTVKAIGIPGESCEKILLMPGAAGGSAQITAIEKEQPDLLICGELQEWETSEYIRDARSKGDKIALMVLGHAVSEEPGMINLVSWLTPKFPGIAITHIASHSPFTWY
ncbi:MAG: Nif3-like dinuclear metal center hexameric protein [Bacteroidetes bacterium]|nr:Nif3-like dinuclear metal center hexameric protein [Bacteroidota bacterium]